MRSSFLSFVLRLHKKIQLINEPLDLLIGESPITRGTLQSSPNRITTCDTTNSLLQQIANRLWMPGHKIFNQNSRGNHRVIQLCLFKTDSA